MKREFIFLGPPASGKGTQTTRLAEYLNLPHVDTGSMLREAIAAKTPDGIIAKSFIDKGNLVPVDIVASVIKDRLSKDDCKKGYILDGYPRSLEQADKLEIINREIDNGETVSFMAVYFDIPLDLLLDRIIYRRSCPCGEIYNLKFNPPKNENVCDKCGQALTQRKDDTKEIAEARFKTYFEQTAPLIEYYENKGVLRKLNAQGSIHEVWERLLEAIN